MITGLTKSPLKLVDPDLKLNQDSALVRLLPLNPKGGQPMVSMVSLFDNDSVIIFELKNLTFDSIIFNFLLGCKPWL